MKVAILSDSHDQIPLLHAGAIQAIELGAETILHAGDVVAPSTLGCLSNLKNPVPVHVIHGNNMGDLTTLMLQANRPGSILRYHGQDAGIVLHDRRIFMVHYPHYAKAMALTGDWDLVICGHSHKVEINQITHIKGGITQYINPGTIGGVGRAPATWVLGDLETMQFEVHELEKAVEALPG